MQLYKNYPILQEELNGVQRIMLNSITSVEGDVHHCIKSMILKGGKMLRPAMVILGAKQGKSYNQEKVLSMAAALEMLHLATLIHDDVIDTAQTRRGVNTIQTHRGNKIAIIAGDYLFSRSFELVAQYSKGKQGLYLAQGVQKICQAELQQNQHAHRLDISPRHYLRRILGKTALLFMLALHVGADAGKASLKTQRLLRKVGYNMGMAFQIIDDILDVQATSMHLGKPVGNDLRQGILTLPGIMQLKKDTSLGALIAQGWAEPENQTVWNTICASVCKGVPEAKAYAETYTNRAIEATTKLPASSETTALHELVQQLLTRDY